MKKNKEIKELETTVDSILTVDKNLLDDEWINQPKLCFNWICILEDAKEEEARIKAEFDLVKAEVELAIRSNPDKYDLPEKTTEKMIASTMLIQPEYEEAQQNVFTIKHKVGVLQGAVTSIEHRKKGLEKLVDLHGQKYFATPVASKNSKEKMQEIEKKLVRRRRRNRDDS